MILVNMLRHDIEVQCPGGPYVIPASGRIATVLTTNGPDERLDVEGVGAVPVTTVLNTIVNVPGKQDSVGYIVTYKTINTMHSLGYDTSDIYAPDLLVTDDRGRVVGCRRLMQMKSQDGVER